jgi:hypothetical protein
MRMPEGEAHVHGFFLFLFLFFFEKKGGRQISNILALFFATKIVRIWV